MKALKLKRRILFTLLALAGVFAGCNKQNLDDSDNSSGQDSIHAEYGVRVAVYKEMNKE